MSLVDGTTTTDPCAFVQGAIDAYGARRADYRTKFGDLPRELKAYAKQMELA